MEGGRQRGRALDGRRQAVRQRPAVLRAHGGRRRAVRGRRQRDGHVRVGIRTHGDRPDAVLPGGGAIRLAHGSVGHPQGPAEQNIAQAGRAGEVLAEAKLEADQARRVVGRRHAMERRRQRRRQVVVAHRKGCALRCDVVAAVRARDDAGRDVAVRLVHGIVRQCHGECGPGGVGRNCHRGRRCCRQVVRPGLLGHRHVDREVCRRCRVGSNSEVRGAALRRRRAGDDSQGRDDRVRCPRRRGQGAERATAVGHPAKALVLVQRAELDDVDQRVAVGVTVGKHHRFALGGQLEVGVQPRGVAVVVVRPDQQVRFAGERRSRRKRPLLGIRGVVG